MSYTNTSLREIQPEIFAELDLEQFHPRVVVEHGLTSRLQVGAELPFLYSWEGFLDPAIRWVEGRTGNLRFVRRTQPTNEFRYFIETDRGPLLNVPRGTGGVGDLTVKAKMLLSEESPVWPAASLRGALKLPTGSFDRGLGSEHADVAVGFIVGKRWDLVGLMLLGEWTRPLGNPFAGSGISVASWVTATVAVDIGLGERLSLFGLLRRVGSPYRHGGLRLLNREIWETQAGFTVVLSRATQLQIGFIEDLFESAEVSSDFTVFVNLIAYRF